ncbi:MAG: hypothetical protein WAX29_12260 [Propionibacterium sp.]
MTKSRLRTLLTASRTGSERQALEQLRDALAARLDDPEISARDYAALSRRFLDVLRELNPPVRTQPEPLILEEPVPDAPFDAWSV